MITNLESQSFPPCFSALVLHLKFHGLHKIGGLCYDRITIKCVQIASVLKKLAIKKRGATANFWQLSAN